MTQEFWDDRAKKFQNTPSTTLSISAHDEEYKKYKDVLQRRAVFKLLKLDKTMTVLDVGCGVGRWSFLVAPQVKKVYATDISNEMVKIAKDIQKEKKIENIEFLQAKVEKLPVKDAQIDAAISITVLQHVKDEDIDFAINELARVCKSGSKVCILESTLEKARSSYLYPRSLKKWTELFNKHNFKLVKWLPVAVLPLDELFAAGSKITNSLPDNQTKKEGKTTKQKIKQAMKSIVLNSSLPFDMYLGNTFKHKSNQKVILFEKN